MAQDRYTQWLRIKPGDRPPDHYTLLGLERFCEDAAQIEKAAHEQLDKLDQYALSPDAANRAACQQMMNEVAQARVVLKDGAKREAYNRELSLRLGLPVAPLLEAAVERKPMVLATTARAAVAASVPSSTPRRDTEVKQPVEPARVAGATSQVPRWLLVMFGTSIVAVLVLVFLLSGASDSLPVDSYDSPSSPTPKIVVDRFEAASNKWQQIRVADSLPKSKEVSGDIDTLMSAAKTAIVDRDYAEAQSVLATVEARIEQLGRLNSASAQFAKLRAEQDFTYLSHYAKADVDACLEQVRIASAADVDVDTALAAYAAATKFLVTAKLNADAMDRLAIVRTEHERELAKHDQATLIQAGPDWIEHDRQLAIANNEATSAAERVEAITKATAALRRSAAQSEMVTHLRAVEGELGQMLGSVDASEMNSKAATEWAAVLETQKRAKDLTLSIAERMKALEEAKKHLATALATATRFDQTNLTARFNLALAKYDAALLEKHAPDEWRQLEELRTKSGELSKNGAASAVDQAHKKFTEVLMTAVAKTRSKELILPLHEKLELRQSPTCFAFAADGRQLALGGRNAINRVDVITGKHTGFLQLPPELSAVRLISFAENNENLTLIGGNYAARWDGLDGLNIYGKWVSATAGAFVISQDQGTAAMVILDDRNIQLEYLKARHPRKYLEHGSYITGIAISGDGTVLVSTEVSAHGVNVWNAGTGQVIDRVAVQHDALPFRNSNGVSVTGRYVSRMSLSRDGKLLAVLRKGDVHLHRTATGKPTGVVIKKDAATPIDPDIIEFSPDGSRIVVGFRRPAERPQYPFAVDAAFARLYDTQTGESVGAVIPSGYPAGHNQPRFRTTFAFSADGKLLAFAGPDWFIRTIRVDTGALFGTPQSMGYPPDEIRFSPKAPILAIRFAGTGIQTWNFDPVVRDPFDVPGKPAIEFNER